VDPLHREQSPFPPFAESNAPSPNWAGLPRGMIQRGASLHEQQRCDHRYR
jgi:hypothetical protein